MAKQHLLVVNYDSESLRVMEVSLRKAGFTVTTAVGGVDGLNKARLSSPDLIVSEIRMPEMDGFEFCRQLKADAKLSDIPFLFLTIETAIDFKVRGLELGVDDYLTKPIFNKELITRIKILLEKKGKGSLERKDPKGRFSGSLSDIGVVDLIQTIEMGRKSGRISFSRDQVQGSIFFRNGKVIDAEAGPLKGEAAVYRLLVWNEGTFEMEFGEQTLADVVTLSTQGLLMEGMRRVDEWSRFSEQLPPLNTRFDIDAASLIDRLSEIPDEANTILKLLDGKHTLLQVIDRSDFGDLEALSFISKLYFEGIIQIVETPEGAPATPEVSASAGAAVDGATASQGNNHPTATDLTRPRPAALPLPPASTQEDTLLTQPHFSQPNEVPMPQVPAPAVPRAEAAAAPASSAEPTASTAPTTSTPTATAQTAPLAPSAASKTVRGLPRPVQPWTRPASSAVRGAGEAVLPDWSPRSPSLLQGAVPKTPEEAFGIGPAPPVFQEHLDLAVDDQVQKRASRNTWLILAAVGLAIIVASSFILWHQPPLP